MTNKRLSNTKDVYLSIIITAHAEGLIAHKTMLSVIEAANMLDASVSYEYIISIDSGDPATIDYFGRYANNPKFNIITVNFKDISKSRNNAIDKSHGKFIAVLDADDLVSDKWLVIALDTIKKYENNAIVHPEYSIVFGDDNLVWHKRNSGDVDHDTLCMVDNNLWDSACLSSRDIFAKYSYCPIGNGFGYEDKQFNCSTLADNIKHVIAPETILFVRRKASNSLLAQSNASRITVAPNKLLSYNSIKSLKYAYQVPQVSKKLFLDKTISRLLAIAKTNIHKLHMRLKKYQIYTNITTPLLKGRKERILSILQNKYPTWMIYSWRHAHKIENLIFPSRDLLKNIIWYNADNIMPGVIYMNIIKTLSKKPDTLFFVPHLIMGGADKVFINYVSNLSEINNTWNIAMLQTEAKNSTWKDLVPKNVDFLNFYDLVKDVDTQTAYRILATVISQLGIKRIIIGNSQFAYNFIESYANLISGLGVTIYCFAFCEDFDEEGRVWGLVHTGIPKIFKLIYRIISDNKYIIGKLEHEYAFDENKFRVHYQPARLKLMPTTNNSNHPIRILWASRVCKQKRPDILKNISNKLDSSSFIIDAYGQLEEGITKDYFLNSKVNYKGTFNGPKGLPTNDYDIFLYTSEGDGVPNILQEMTAAGLPIVASNVGGINEFINNETGRLVIDYENIDDYIKAIKSLIDYKVRKKLNMNAQNTLKTLFSEKEFILNLKKDFDR